MAKGEGGEDFGVAQMGKRADLLATFFGGRGEKGKQGKGKSTSLFVSVTYGPGNKSPPEPLSEPQAVCAGVKRINCWIMMRRGGMLLKPAVQCVAREKG